MKVRCENTGKRHEVSRYNIQKGNTLIRRIITDMITREVRNQQSCEQTVDPNENSTTVAKTEHPSEDK